MMKFSFSNLLAITAILVWATAWAATEQVSAAEQSNSAPISVSLAR